ncbi:MAG: glycoside hydrolase [Marinilabiliales bacterium]|nr:MAG: glycoside hydrolase [Marinilabiliales bacterium]
MMFRFKKYNTQFLIFSLLALMLLTSANLISQDLSMIKSLEGRWKFSIGDNLEWAHPDYDDSHWESIHVPGSWENQGFHGYDGYAWYRLKIILPEKPAKESYYLLLGYIDDVDEVFINGKKIGQTGQFPPYYSTAYTANRSYFIPNGVITNDEVHIAVRVYDELGEGGIVGGNVSLQMDMSSAITDLNLSGNWKFKTDLCTEFNNLDISGWDDIIVPGKWEDQGYKDYDGYACYAKEFTLNSQFEGKHMILLLGKIDDLDMVYLNGTLIGQSGPFNPATMNLRSDTYQQFRSYHIPSGLLNQSGKNTIVVNVYDGFMDGGIYEGSIGLISQENYISYWNKRRKER